MTVYPISSNPQLASAAAKRQGEARALVVAVAPATGRSTNPSTGGIG
jgi:hypothetical protein